MYEVLAREKCRWFESINKYKGFHLELPAIKQSIFNFGLCYHQVNLSMYIIQLLYLQGYTHTLNIKDTKIRFKMGS